MIRRPLWNRSGGVFVEELWPAAAGAAATSTPRAAVAVTSAEATPPPLAADETPVEPGGRERAGAWVHVRIVTER